MVRAYFGAKETEAPDQLLTAVSFPMGVDTVVHLYRSTSQP